MQESSGLGMPTRYSGKQPLNGGSGRSRLGPFPGEFQPLSLFWLEMVRSCVTDMESALTVSVENRT